MGRLPGQGGLSVRRHHDEVRQRLHWEAGLSVRRYHKEGGLKLYRQGGVRVRRHHQDYCQQCWRSAVWQQTEEEERLMSHCCCHLSGNLSSCLIADVSAVNSID